MYIKLDRDYEVKTTLGAIREIERAFDNSFFEVINGVTNMKIEQQIKLLYIGVKKANPDMSEQRFNELCDDNLGLVELIEALEKYLVALQFSGLSESEVQEKLAKKSQPTVSTAGKKAK